MDLDADDDFWDIRGSCYLEEPEAFAFICQSVRYKTGQFDSFGVAEAEPKHALSQQGWKGPLEVLSSKVVLEAQNLPVGPGWMRISVQVPLHGENSFALGSVASR